MVEDRRERDDRGYVGEKRAEGGNMERDKGQKIKVQRMEELEKMMG